MRIYPFYCGIHIRDRNGDCYPKDEDMMLLGNIHWIAMKL